MNNKFLLGILAILIVSGISVSSLLRNLSNENEQQNFPEEQEVVCTMDAKQCPDGTYVGRTGKDCHFAECPAGNVEKFTVSTNLGKQVNAGNVSITPKEVVSDSRCPVGVQCIWEGTVELKTALTTKVGNGEKTLKLNSPEILGDYSITLIEVSPTPKESTKIPAGSYKFTFEINKIK